MTAPMATLEQAVGAVRAVEVFFADEIRPGLPPDLRQDFEGTDPPAPWAIVWERGPDAWALRFSQALSDGAVTGWDQQLSFDLLNTWSGEIHPA